MTALERVKGIAQKCEDSEKPKVLMIGDKEHHYVSRYKLSKSDVAALRTLARQYERLLAKVPK